MLQFPTSREVSVLSDWVEASCLFSGESTISWSMLESLFQENDLRNSEDRADSVWRELERREQLGSGSYPFRLTRTTLYSNRLWTTSTCYSFALMLSLHSVYFETQPP